MTSAKLTNERLDELIQHYHELAVHQEQLSDNGRFSGALELATEYWVLHDALRELRAYHDPKWKLVPVEPTEEMLRAGIEFMTITPGSVTLKATGHVYEAMIEASPEVMPT